jgi:hypothetical protein
MQAAAREKVDNHEAMLDAARFITSAMEAHTVLARDELKKLESRKPRAPKAAAAPPPTPVAPPAKYKSVPSQAALACESAAVAPRGVKRVRTVAPQQPVGRQDGGGGAGAGDLVHHYNPLQVAPVRGTYPRAGPTAQHTAGQGRKAE